MKSCDLLILSELVNKLLHGKHSLDKGSILDILCLLDQLLCNLALLASLLGQNLATTKSLCVGVETDKHSSVDERVLALGEGTLDYGLAGGTNDRLDLVRVDETGQIRVGDDGVGEAVVFLKLGRGGGCSVQLIELLECVFGPDDESANMATRGELEEVEG
jgi:hypothetical protein